MKHWKLYLIITVIVVIVLLWKFGILEKWWNSFKIVIGKGGFFGGNKGNLGFGNPEIFTGDLVYAKFSFWLCNVTANGTTVCDNNSPQVNQGEFLGKVLGKSTVYDSQSGKNIVRLVIDSTYYNAPIGVWENAVYRKGENNNLA